MRLFAPLYLSSECINNCQYCGFSRDNPILRVTLSTDEVEAEARYLVQQGFRNILLVSGEHPKFVSTGYLLDVVRQIGFLCAVRLDRSCADGSRRLPATGFGRSGRFGRLPGNVRPRSLRRSSYRRTETGFRLAIGNSGTCVRGRFPANRDRSVVWAGRMATEAIALAEHVEYLLKNCWRSQLTVSLPRLRPAAGGFRPRYSFSDRDLIQVLCALRMTFPQWALS